MTKLIQIFLIIAVFTMSIESKPFFFGFLRNIFGGNRRYNGYDDGYNNNNRNVFNRPNRHYNGYDDSNRNFQADHDRRHNLALEEAKQWQQNVFEKVEQWPATSFTPTYAMSSWCT